MTEVCVSSTPAGRRGLRWTAALGIVAVALLCSSAGVSAASASIESTFAANGPYATSSVNVLPNASGSPQYEIFYPSNYAALGFKSPIVTWGNGTNGNPDEYSILLKHFASWGFTVVASTVPNTGPGVEIAGGVLVAAYENGTAGTPFYNQLDTGNVAAVGHSQGAGGAVNAAVKYPSMFKAVMTFSLPSLSTVTNPFLPANPACPLTATQQENACYFNPAALTVPTFFIGTRGGSDSVIASPATETAFYNSVSGHFAALGLINQTTDPNGTTSAADHNSIMEPPPPGATNVCNQGHPYGYLGYATAWLEAALRGNWAAILAFAGTSPYPEIVNNPNWSGSLTKTG